MKIDISSIVLLLAIICWFLAAINSATANLYLKDTSTGWQAATTLIVTPQTNNSIRATSYTSGLTGWNVNAVGDAEFNNLDVRGAIHLPTGRINLTALGLFFFGVSLLVR